jgi:tripeptide aminopeptidase
VLWKDYDGTDIVLKNGRILSADLFPHLKTLKGRTLITSDGTTLLGADDKAGIAEIMTMAEEVISSGMPHGRIAIAFTPDEEIGHGADALDLNAFGAEYAYTVDGGAEDELEYENFNAAGAVYRIHGVSVHPGDAKGVMINAALVANEVVSLLPSAETPAHTEGREGFYHVTGISGDVEQAEVSLIIRDHSEDIFKARIETVKMIAKVLNERYGDGTVILEVHEQYRNMIEKIRPHMHLIENARSAMRDAGLIPKEIPVRGGTDGARLSWRGLPCPNLGTGGYAFHGPYEHITAEGMDRAVDVILGIVKRYAES